MKTLAIKITFGRKSTKEESFRLFLTYNDAIDFVKAWTKNPDNYASNPMYVKVDDDTFNNLWNL